MYDNSNFLPAATVVLPHCLPNAGGQGRAGRPHREEERLRERPRRYGLVRQSGRFTLRRESRQRG